MTEAAITIRDLKKEFLLSHSGVGSQGASRLR
jgi:hypothetical protein